MECQRYISTGPGRIDVYNGSSPIKGIDYTLPSYPGEILQLPIKAFDDLNHTIPVVYTTSSDISPINHTIHNSPKIDPDFAYVSNNVIRVYGDGGQNLTLNLNSIGDRVWHVKMMISLQECPPGLLPTTVNCSATGNDSKTDQCNTCECLPENNYGAAVRCNSLSNAGALQISYVILSPMLP